MTWNSISIYRWQVFVLRYIFDEINVRTFTLFNFNALPIPMKSPTIAKIEWIFDSSAGIWGLMGCAHYFIDYWLLFRCLHSILKADRASLFTNRLSTKYKYLLNINREWMNVWEYEALCTMFTFEHVSWESPSICHFIFSSLLIFFPFSVFPFTQFSSFFICVCVCVFFQTNSTEIPLPSSPSKQLTHTISEPKDTSKWLYTYILCVFFMLCIP